MNTSGKKGSYGAYLLPYGRLPPLQENSYKHQLEGEKNRILICLQLVSLLQCYKGHTCFFVSKMILFYTKTSYKTTAAITNCSRKTSITGDKSTAYLWRCNIYLSFNENVSSWLLPASCPVGKTKCCSSSDFCKQADVTAAQGTHPGLELLAEGRHLGPAVLFIGLHLLSDALLGHLAEGGPVLHGLLQNFLLVLSDLSEVFQHLILPTLIKTRPVRLPAAERRHRSDAPFKLPLLKGPPCVSPLQLSSSSFALPERSPSSQETAGLWPWPLWRWG